MSREEYLKQLKLRASSILSLLQDAEQDEAFDPTDYIRSDVEAIVVYLNGLDML